MTLPAFLIGRQRNTGLLRGAQPALNALQIVGLVDDHGGRPQFLGVGPRVIQPEPGDGGGRRVAAIGGLGEQQHDVQDRLFGIVAVRAKEMADRQRLPAAGTMVGDQHIFDHIERFTVGQPAHVAAGRPPDLFACSVCQRGAGG
ncbi:MAG: hypothetical protein H7267_06280 [Sandarakinorhabdus sp.]|nr:hypothetical protein [Sandarakinorhabdus sp.]